jgi:TfoX/Sxy family transcriptional regulator of competence genes
MAASRKRVARSAQPLGTPSLIEHLREQVQDAVRQLPGVERRKMLVSIGWMVNQRTFALVNRQARIVVRLAQESARQELLALDGAEPWQFGKRKPLRDWLLLPEAMHDDAEALQAWLKRAWTLAREAGPKPKRRKAAVSRSRRPVRARA